MIDRALWLTVVDVCCRQDNLRGLPEELQRPGHPTAGEVLPRQVFQV